MFIALVIERIFAPQKGAMLFIVINIKTEQDIALLMERSFTNGGRVL